MQLGSLFVKRPVMTSMAFIGLVLFGLIAWLHLPQELFPNISVPQLIIITKYPNAAPEEIENLITKPIEEAVGTVPNLRRVTSISKEGLSAVKLEFAWGTDMGFAHLSAREKIDRMKDRLPQEAEESIIKRVNPFSHPVLIISVTGDLELASMTKICEDIVKKKLEKTDGVASIAISGGQEKEYLVEVDRGRLEASSISLPMVVEALKNANYDYPAGTTQGQVMEYLVRTKGRFEKMSDIGQTVVQVENPSFDPVYRWKRDDVNNDPSRSTPMEQRLVTLDSLATVSQGLEEKTSYSRYNGKENISLSIQKQADANTVEVSKAVRRALEELKPSLPSNMQLEVIYDEATYIKDSLSAMRDNIVLGGVLAFIVLFFFLGDIRQSLFAGLAIPMSMLATLIIMSLSGFSVNMLTLAGLALSVGSMADWSICITENITRHRKELKKPPLESAVEGTDELAASMISSTLTNVAALLPLLFVSGIAEQLFHGLFMVTIFTHFTALIVSMTFIPRMSAYDWDLPFLDRWQKKLSRYVMTEEKQHRMAERYRKILEFAFTHPKTVLETAVMAFAGALLLLMWTPKVFMPGMDQGQFQVQLNMPIGTRLEVTNEVAKKLESILTSFPDVNVALTVGSAQDEEDIDALQAHQAQLAVTVDLSKGFTTQDIIDKFKRLADRENLEGGQLTYVLQDSPLRSALAGAAPIEIEIKGPDLAYLKSLSDDLVKKLEMEPHLYGIQSTFALPSKETQVVVDKDRAGSFQLSVADIAKTALIAIKGMVATKFKDGADDINIRVRLRKEDRESSDSVRQLALRSPAGYMVRLDDVAKVLPGTGASEIRHLDQQRAFVVTAQVSGESTAKAAERVEEILSGMRTMKDYSLELGGESKKMEESFASLKYTFLLAALLIYMIMAAQFESLMQPLIIMTTVPLSVIGVAITLFVTNTPLSSAAALGVLILSGIVVNNGIVMIDHINDLLHEGHDLRYAVIHGSAVRLRPVLMTTFVTILGVLPLTLGIGTGDELAQPLALVTFGGLFVSTLLTLIVIPLLYYEISRWQAARRPVPAAKTAPAT